MRLVRSQAKVTKAYLKKANDILIKAIRTGNFVGLQTQLEKELRLLPQQAMQLVISVAEYEAQFTYKKLKKVKNNAVELSTTRAVTIVEDVKIKASIDRTPLSIRQTYTTFVENKVQQYVQLARDIETQDLDEDEAEQLVNEKTNGLFTAQNLALAGLAILGTANMIRNEVADINYLNVDWSLDLELNNCPYCEEMADGGPYDPAEVDGLIPAHANCGCTLVPIFDEEF